MSLVLQEPFLYSNSVANNIRFARRRATQEDIETATKALGAHDFIMKLPQGYETILHERGSNLSVGQRQLIAFARALVADPRILILDEATANVDSYTERLIQDALKERLAGGRREGLLELNQRALEEGARLTRISFRLEIG